MAKRQTFEEILKRFKNAHSDKYDYSKVNYINNRTKVTIICPIHGEFQQIPNLHYRGIGCPECGKIKSHKSKTLTTNEWIKRAKSIHGDKYDYSKVNYIRNDLKVEIICKRHGSFFQVANSHIVGMKAGCPRCNYSKGEGLISYYLNNQNIIFKSQYSFKDCCYKRPLRFDFYLPDYNICIEYDGKQHFINDKFYASKDDVKLNRLRDSIKNTYCKENNIKLIRIPYTKIENIKDILDKELLNGKSS